MQVRLSFLIVFFSALLLMVSPAFSTGGSAPSGEGVSPHCEAAIDKAAGYYSKCLLKASAKYAKSKKKNEDRLFAQQAKCEDKWSAQVARAQDRFGEDQCTPYLSEIAARTETYAEAVTAEANNAAFATTLFVQNSTGGTLSEDTLTLTGVSAKTSWFTDRPYREAGQITIEKFLSFWDEGENSFDDDPPDADFTCEVSGDAVNYVVELSSPELVGENLAYSVKAVGDTVLPVMMQCESPSHLFIDVLPLASCSSSDGRGLWCGCSKDSQCASHLVCGLPMDGGAPGKMCLF